MSRFILFLTVLLVAFASRAQDLSTPKPTYDFPFNSAKELSAFTLSDAGNWIISKNGNGGKCLKHIETSQTNDSSRLSTLLFNDMEIGSFILKADVMQTPTNYDLVQLCLIFGFQTDDEYACAQLASQADRFTHNIFVVQNNDRLRILEKQERGTEWGFEQWNTLAIERNIPQCSLKVWIDNSLVFESNDARLMKKGKVGLGNSGDSYKLDNLKLWIAD